jgi:rSAM/selenodomain-associated transferase 2
MSERPWLSVIVPVLDEAARLQSSLDRLAALEGVDELLVVDGGSSDGTPDIVEAHAAARLVVAPRGRGRQLHAGARAAQGLVLWFVHADVQPPADAVAHIRRTLMRPGVVAGAFRTRTVADRPTWIEPVLPLADTRARYTRTPYGDQALFCRADAYRAAGGFPPQPLHEDLELARRLRKVGRLRVCDAEVLVSARRYERSPFKTSVIMNSFPVLYRLGVPPEQLARWYAPAR